MPFASHILLFFLNGFIFLLIRLLLSLISGALLEESVYVLFDSETFQVWIFDNCFISDRVKYLAIFASPLC